MNNGYNTAYNSFSYAFKTNLETYQIPVIENSNLPLSMFKRV